MGVDSAAVADEVLAALDAKREIAPLTARIAGFDAAAAYAVADVLRQRRGARGERPVGRKIGFTNRNIWQEYGVYEPIWGDVYSSTLFEAAPGARIRIARLPQPRIEPEIVLGLTGDLSGGMDLADIAERIGWIAHGFEIVQSVYPGWHCSVADCVADGGLHGLLCVGPKRAPSADERRRLADTLSGIGIELACDGRFIDRGIGANVLGGPVQALKHLADLLARDPTRPQLRAGELVTTGTLTRAFPIAPGERWSTVVSGVDLPGMDVAFC